jgi:hypothetical protein
MLRNILAVIAGYIGMAIVVMGGLTGAYLTMGADKAFEPATYEVTTTWLIVWGAVSIVSAIVAGLICAKMSKHSKGAVISLVILTGVLGAANSVYMVTREIPPENLVRIGDTSNFEAMNKGIAPKWVYIAEPLIGIVGVILGAMIVCPDRKKSGSPVE